MTYTLVYTSDRGSVEFSLQSGYIIEKFDSAQSVSVEFSTSAGSRIYGEKVETQRVQPKSITISGVLKGLAEEKKKKLLRIISPMQKGVLTFNGRYFMDVYPKQSPTVERYDRNPRFSFLLYAPVPYWHNMDGTTISMRGLDGLFSFPWDWGSSFQFSARRSGAVNVYNDGDAPSAWELTVNAETDIKNPCLTKTTTGEYVKVNATITAGQQLTISTVKDEMSVILIDAEGNAVDMFSYLDIESTSFYLDVGDNLLEFTPSSDASTTTISFFQNIAGV